jgi:hypothetical protein
MSDASGRIEAETLMPRRAVLFKTHFWDDFVARRFAALKPYCPASDLWIFVDETAGPIDDIPHDKVFRARDSDMYALGLPEQPGVSLNWYNADYPLLAFHAAHAEYAFYVMIEFDAVVRHDLDHLAAEALRRRIDLIAYPSREPIETWGWTPTLEGLWSRDEMRSQLLCVSGFSERAIAHLMTIRKALAVRGERGELLYWPFCEGIVPTALGVAGFTLESLASFGSTEHYDWWPPYHESELPELADQAFVHPVLTGPRYVTALLCLPGVAAAYLTEPGWREKLDLEPPQIVVPALIEALVRDKNSEALIALHRFIDDRGWHDLNFIPPPDLET